MDGDENVEMRHASSFFSLASTTLGSTPSLDNEAETKKKDGRGRLLTHGRCVGVSRARTEIRKKKTAAAAAEVLNRKRLASESEYLDEEKEGRAADREKRHKRQARREFLKEQPASDLTLDMESVGRTLHPRGNGQSGARL